MLEKIIMRLGENNYQVQSDDNSKTLYTLMCGDNELIESRNCVRHLVISISEGSAFLSWGSDRRREIIKNNRRW